MTVEKKYFEQDKYRNVEGILKIVQDDLCHRCGACIGVCPVGTFGMDENGYPIKVNDCIECNICVQTCSGVQVDYDAIGQSYFGDRYDYQDLMGPVDGAYIAHAGDPVIRNGGASGGAVTQLFAHMLKKGMIKGAIVAVEDPDQPAMGKGIVARTYEQLLESQQSRYTTSPHLHVLSEIQDEDGPFAMVGLPCQLHSLRKRQLIDPRWKGKIPYTIGLFCHYNLPTQSSKEAASLLTPPGEKVIHAKYRQRDERGWPHNTLHLTFSDGTSWRSPHGPAQTFNIVSTVSHLGRCLQCLDPSAEFCDITISDPWIRGPDGNWKYEEPGGFSVVLTRTRLGEKIMQEAISDGDMVVKVIDPEEIRVSQHQMMYDKKAKTAFRIKVRKALGMPTPEYTMKLHKATAKDIRKEMIFWVFRIIPTIGPLRRALLRFFFSERGVRFFAKRLEKRKKRVQQGKIRVYQTDVSIREERIRK